MAPFVTSEDAFHATRDDFDCDLSSNDSLSDSQTTELRELETINIHRVRFQLAKPKVLDPETEYFSAEEYPIRWWSAEELKKIWQSIKTLCARIRVKTKCQDHELITAHRKITLILASNFSLLTKMSPLLPEQDLPIWCSYNDGRRGLERFASRVYSFFHMNDIVVTRKAVLREQSRQRQEGVNNPDMLAKLCQ